MNTFKLLPLVSVFALSALSFSASAEPVTLKMAFESSDQSSVGKAATLFMDLVVKYTGNAVNVEIIAKKPAKKLFDEEAVDIAVISVGEFEKKHPEFKAFEFPYAFNSLESAYAFEDAEGKTILKSLSSSDIVGLGFWSDGFRNLHSEKEIKFPSDLTGKKVVIQNSEVRYKWLRMLGSTVRVADKPNVETLFLHNLADTGDSTLNEFLSSNLMASQKYISLSSHMYATRVVVANKKKMDSLGAKVKAGIERAMKESTVAERKWLIAEEAESLAKIKKSSIVRVMPVNDKTIWSDMNQEFSKINNE